MRVNSRMASKKVKGKYYCRMEIVMQVLGKMMKSTVQEATNSLKGISMMDSFSTGRGMEEVCTGMKMEMCMKASGGKI